MFDEAQKKYDQSNLHDVIDVLPSQLIKAFGFTKAKFNSAPNRIFIFGMGGSALPANIVKTIISNSSQSFNIPIHVVRDYDLPKNLSAADAGIFISYSGNTEETISALEEAIKQKQANIITIATGGKLKDIASTNNLPFIEIPHDVLQPRMGYGYFVGALL